MIEHHARRQQQARRVGHPPPRDVRRRSVHRLEDRMRLTDVPRRREPQPPHQPRHQVAQDVPEHVLHDQHVEAVRIEHQEHGGRVDDPVLEGDPVRVPLRHAPPHLQEQPLRVLQDVRLVGQRDLAPPVRNSVVEGKAHDPLRSEAGGDHDRFRGRLGVALHPDEVLDADVQPLGVLADQHQVDVLVAPARQDGPHGTHVGEQIELLADGHVDRAEPRPGGRGQRPLERHPVGLDRIERLLGERTALVPERRLARHPLVVIQPRAGRV